VVQFYFVGILDIVYEQNLNTADYINQHKVVNSRRFKFHPFIGHEGP